MWLFCIFFPLSYHYIPCFSETMLCETFEYSPVLSKMPGFSQEDVLVKCYSCIDCGDYGDSINTTSKHWGADLSDNHNSKYLQDLGEAAGNTCSQSSSLGFLHKMAMYLYLYFYIV